MDLNLDVSPKKNELRINAEAAVMKQKKGTRTALVIRNMQVKEYKPAELDEKPPIVSEILQDELNYLQKIELEKQQKMQLQLATSKKKIEAGIGTQSAEGDEEDLLDDTFINELDDNNCK